MIKYAKKTSLSAAASIAVCAAQCALLIAAQLALGAVAGVEFVTVLLLSFSAYFGIACGVTTAVCFSLLRCLIWGFYPSAMVLYLIYYPLFALIFALLGKTGNKPTVLKYISVSLILLIFTVVPTVFAALNIFGVSKIYAVTVNALLWTLGGISFALLVSFNAVFFTARKGKFDERSVTLFIMCAAACALTACFTLLDDVITPLFYKLDKAAATAYFYGSFAPMIPQIICSAVSVLFLYFPLTVAYSKACPRRKIIDKRVEK